MINTDRLSDEELVEQGYACLLEHLGTIGTERFISYIKHEQFDYTQWRKGLFKDNSSKEIIDAAAKYEEDHPFTPSKPQIQVNETNSDPHKELLGFAGTISREIDEKKELAAARNEKYGDCTDDK